MKTRLATALIVSTFLAASAFAADGHDAHHTTTASAAASVHLVDGTVKKVDRSAGKITLAHGPLENLGMPAMTMSFPVKEPLWLDGVKTGDKVRFVADKVGGAITVVRLEPAR